MIVVRNTKELENRYVLSEIADSEEIKVLGGLEGKSKYFGEKYQNRITYPAWQLKKIISEMKEIEKRIPENWSKWQRAKYIYETLANDISYDYTVTKVNSKEASSLIILLNKRGICSGYSLLFKEMMDRQGIECDYIRGRYNLDKHAWNVLTIDGNSFPVDLTFDSNRIKRKEGICDFGGNTYFSKLHIQDKDEKEYDFFHVKDNGKNIDININYAQILSQEIKNIYKKAKKVIGIKKAETKIIDALKKYILKSIKERNLTNDTVIDLMVGEYVDLINDSIEEKNEFEYAIFQMKNIYTSIDTKKALSEYIKNNISNRFTRRNNVRKIIESYSKEEVVDFIVNRIVLEKEKDVSQEVKSKEASQEDKEKDSNKGNKTLFEKRKILHESMITMYQKMIRIIGKEKAIEKIKKDFKKYVFAKKEDKVIFPGIIKELVKEGITKEDLTQIFVQDYVKQVSGSKKIKNNIEYAVCETMDRYSIKQSEEGLYEYILSKDLSKFTRTNDARRKISALSPDEVLEQVLDKIVDGKIKEQERKDENIRKQKANDDMDR